MYICVFVRKKYTKREIQAITSKVVYRQQDKKRYSKEYMSSLAFPVNMKFPTLYQEQFCEFLGSFTTGGQ